MRGWWSRIAAPVGLVAAVAAGSFLAAGSAAATADPGASTTAVTPSTTAADTTTIAPSGTVLSAVTSTTDTSTTTTTTTTTTSTPPTTVPLVVALPAAPAAVTPERGTQAQVTDTQPPPPTLPPGWEVPAGSGEGRRVVYSKSRQRVWTVEENGIVSKSHLVSGRRTWNQPKPGTYSVFSRSSYTCNIKNPDICWRYMVRFAKGPSGDNIGFHEIPTRVSSGTRVQTVSQLGQPLSGGCVRQATPDAQYMWGWAPIGTKVVVLP